MDDKADDGMVGKGRKPGPVRRQQREDRAGGAAGIEEVAERFSGLPGVGEGEKDRQRAQVQRQIPDVKADLRQHIDVLQRLAGQHGPAEGVPQPPPSVRAGAAEAEAQRRADRRCDAEPQDMRQPEERKADARGQVLFQCEKVFHAHSIAGFRRKIYPILLRWENGFPRQCAHWLGMTSSLTN